MYLDKEEFLLFIRFIAESREGVLKLNITEATDADEGDYTCEAINNIGFIYCTAHLKIGSKCIHNWNVLTNCNIFYIVSQMSLPSVQLVYMNQYIYYAFYNTTCVSIAGT